MTPGLPHRRGARQRGAALLMALLIAALAATLAAGMVWQQWQAIEVEAAQRARTQALWLVQGAVDWARLILRSDAQDSKRPDIDSLDEVWATPLQDVKLSEFLAADRNNTSDTALEAFLSGQITDAQARYNLRNLASADPQLRALHRRLLQRLCEVVGLAPSVANAIADGFDKSRPGTTERTPVQATTPLLPQRLSQLSWFGLDDAVIRQLTPFVVILPEETKVNLNTAPPEVLMALVDGLDRASAERLLRERLNGGFESLTQAQALLPERLVLDGRWLDKQSAYFEILGALRYDDFVVREQVLVQRRGREVNIVMREHLPAADTP